ncbi:MAG: OmpA family protein [Crocinitomicaceae bacterium]|nr:OmpA family protein [Flavobacteriales bacterium]NQZ35180.1 OmpA family protein [Crocinitomicaceae bacterium]
MRIIFLKSVLFLCVVLGFYQSPLAQDSLHYAMTIQLKCLRYPICITWNNELAENQFEIENANYFDSIAHFVKSNPQATFELRCYTDSRGSDTLNLSLSQKRADDWVKHLVNRGVDTNSISGIGVGEMFPRQVWLKDSIYYTEKPNDHAAIEVYLNDDCINSHKKNHEKFIYLHQLNRRTELNVNELDRSVQSRINSVLYLKELYGDKQVVRIGSGTIENNDTLSIENKGDLHLHLIAPGTENEFTIRSLERDEEYSYNKFRGDGELLNLNDAKGTYELDFFGDGGSGELILVIY